ncbi:hypothetical protein ABPG75_004215 [Micractinium tetrahymenae]
MPKLSAYVEQQAGQNRAGPPAGAAAAVPPPAGAGTGQSQALPASPPTLQPAEQQQQQQQPASEAGQQELEQLQSAASAKLQADYAKRLREHGPRTFRWPDGSLRPERPPPNPHAVANRREWAPLVQHCRTHGGDRAYERTGASLRYGLGVTHEQYAAYLAVIGLQPEADEQGQYAGDVPGLPRPLEEPGHCFNTYYKEGAEAVFKDKRGRLL